MNVLLIWTHANDARQNESITESVHSQTELGFPKEGSVHASGTAAHNNAYQRTENNQYICLNYFTINKRIAIAGYIVGAISFI